MGKRLTSKTSLTAHTVKTLAQLTTSGKLIASVSPDPLLLSQLEPVQSKHWVNALVAISARV